MAIVPGKEVGDRAVTFGADDCALHRWSPHVQQTLEAPCDVDGQRNCEGLKPVFFEHHRYGLIEYFGLKDLSRLRVGVVDERGLSSVLKDSHRCPPRNNVTAGRCITSLPLTGYASIQKWVIFEIGEEEVRAWRVVNVMKPMNKRRGPIRGDLEILKDLVNLSVGQIFADNFAGRLKHLGVRNEVSLDQLRLACVNSFHAGHVLSRCKSGSHPVRNDLV